MQTALELSTVVLPGHRIEVSTPELPEGANVRLIVLSEPKSVSAAPQIFGSALEYLQSLPPIHRTPEAWAAIERELQEDKDSWDR